MSRVITLPLAAPFSTPVKAVEAVMSCAACGQVYRVGIKGGVIPFDAWRCPNAKCKPPNTAA